MTSSPMHTYTPKFLSYGYGHVVAQKIGLIELSISAYWITSPTHSYQKVHGIWRFPLCSSHRGHVVTKNSIMVSKNSNKIPYHWWSVPYFLFFENYLVSPSHFVFPGSTTILFRPIYLLYLERFVASPHNLALNDNTSLTHTGSAHSHTHTHTDTLLSLYPHHADLPLTTWKCTLMNVYIKG